MEPVLPVSLPVLCPISFPIQRAAVHMIQLHLLQRVCHPLHAVPMVLPVCTALPEPAPQRGLLTHPTLIPSAAYGFPFCPATPTVRNTKPGGFLHHHSSQRGAFPPFPRSQNLSFLRRKRGRNSSGCMELCCPCPTLLVRTMMCLNLPWGPLVRV